TDSAISGLMIRNGQRPGASVDGAGLVNLGALAVSDCTFATNVATGFAGTQPGQAGGSARGGAVFNGGTMTLNRCSFSSNSVHGGNGANNSAQFGSGGNGGVGMGGAIFNDTNATLFVNNCSFFNNTGTGGNGGNDPNFGGGNGGAGSGGIFSQGIMTLIACTLNGNTAMGGNGGLGNNSFNNGRHGSSCGGLNAAAGTNLVGNTIVMGNIGITGPDALGTFTSQGWNLIGKTNGSAGFAAMSDQIGTIVTPLDARLAPFGNYGGPNNTFLLFSDSPAIDKGKSFSLVTDQRNLPRLYDDPAIANASGGDGTDIGAVEMQPNYTGPLKVLSITRVGATARVTLQGISFANYQLQKNEILGTPFANFGVPQIADSIGQTEFTDFGPLPATRFYRAVQTP
ncbi:MAG: hypothetical protein M3Y82_08955, partial [Verrucomicrobiota bacterium]|nr:hypothetical protein [Verrucomicrobiota bacterium]